MGPIFNPLYWLVGVAAIISGALLSGLVGLPTYFLLRRATSQSSPAAKKTPLPIAAVLAALAFTVTTCLICSLSLTDPNLPQSMPRDEDVVGRWTPSEFSLQKMAEQGGYPLSVHEIVFEPDGAFSIVNMPDWWLNRFGESTGGFYSGQGTWKIAQWQRGRWVIEVRFTSLHAHDQTVFPTPDPWDPTGPQDGLTTFFDLSGRQPPYTIVIYIGDPDSADVIVFNRLEDGPQ